MKHTVLDENLVRAAIAEAAHDYFEGCLKRVPDFSRRCFLYPGAWRINKRAFGWDLVKVPVNVVWAPFYILACCASILAKRAGWLRIHKFFKATPSGFSTRVHADVQKLIYSELLAGDGHSANDVLKEAIIARLQSISAAQGQYTPSVALYASAEDLIQKEMLQHEIQREHSDEFSDFSECALQLQAVLDQALEQYAITRTASADISNSVVSTLGGALVFKQFTPGGLGLGVVCSAIAAKYYAVDDFIFGHTLGHFYYDMFPPSASVGLLLVSTGITLMVLALFASFSGLVSDPLQHLLGIHQHRLRKMILFLQRDFKHRNTASFHPKDQYLARIIDIFDAVKTHVV